MRLFTAIDLPPDVLGALTRLLERLKPTARLKWSPPENLHITTKFIGEWPEQRRVELESALRGLGAFDPIPICLRGLGFFPNPHAPRVFWVGVEAGPGLAELARRTDAALARLGVPAETRPFSPHLTLARIKEPVPLAGLRQAIAQLETVEFGAFFADRFHLYLSELRPAGSVYTKLSEFRFAP
ncbi:MAG: RNA 2',3'-cyclic phosphodiesterase [Bryobacteraceae bacterium]